jgi:hypothetical protein
VIAELEAVTLDEVRAAGAKMLAGPRARATIGFPAVRRREAPPSSPSPGPITA